MPPAGLICAKAPTISFYLSFAAPDEGGSSQYLEALDSNLVAINV